MSRKPKLTPQPGWALYLRTSSLEAQNPRSSQERQRYSIQQRLFPLWPLPVVAEYADTESGKRPDRRFYQQMLADARTGKFSHIGVENAERFGRSDTEALRAIDELHEFGVAVRFADYPDIDPMSADGRVMVSFSFTLARRESMKLGERTSGGIQTKMRAGGWPRRAPDGYRNVEQRTDKADKTLEGRYTRWVEPDPAQWPVWRMAWELLLTDRYTLDEICQQLHEAGYTFKSGRAFAKMRGGQTSYAHNGLSKIFHNWFYAGWVTSPRFDIPPKTIRGHWEPLVSTEEFERGLAILKHRAASPAPEHKHFYLLKGLLHLQHGGRLTRLTCSRPNTKRKGGGTAYYNAPKLSWYIQCDEVDDQIAQMLDAIQVDPAHLPLIRHLYETEVRQIQRTPAEELHKLQQALAAIDEEESRVLRLYAGGKISEKIWEHAWQDWQARRQGLSRQMDVLAEQGETLLDNLDEAVLLLTQITRLYATLSEQKQRELLRLMVEKVVVNEDGDVLPLRLLPPFAYLHEKGQQAKNSSV